jgi:hypothetical protein
MAAASFSDHPTRSRPTPLPVHVAVPGTGPRRTIGAVIWALLALIGVPLSLCAVAIVTLVLRNRTLRRRAANIPVRLRGAESRRWRPDTPSGPTTCSSFGEAPLLGTKPLYG